jgi:hypothetical protein
MYSPDVVVGWDGEPKSASESHKTATATRQEEQCHAISDANYPSLTSREYNRFIASLKLGRVHM